MNGTEMECKLTTTHLLASTSYKYQREYYYKDTVTVDEIIRSEAINLFVVQRPAAAVPTQLIKQTVAPAILHSLRTQLASSHILTLLSHRGRKKANEENEHYIPRALHHLQI